MQLNRNTRGTGPKTHEGVAVRHISPAEELRRTALSCFLFEGNFYEDGVAVAERVKQLVPQVDPRVVVDLAIEARNEHNLRHLPLWLIVSMLASERHRKHVYEPIVQCVNRPDEICELIAMYFDGGKKPIPHQMKIALAETFHKFDAYQFAKYNRKKEVTLRDAMFLTHPKPRNTKEQKIWEQLIDGTLSSPDTWEVALSSGEDKAATFTRLMQEGKLGAMATIRNLRNMEEVGVPRSLVRSYLEQLEVGKILPFRFFVAARHAPAFEPELEAMFFKATDAMTVGEVPLKLSGKTLLLVDVSGSMMASLSDRSEVSRMEAGAVMAALASEYSDDVDVYAFGTICARVPPRRGFALVDAIRRINVGHSTRIGSACAYAHKNSDEYDRMIVITDGQSWDSLADPYDGRAGYIINVAPYQMGVGYGPWIEIDGFSYSVFPWMFEYENECLAKVQ